MTQAIIFTNDNGGISICISTGELPIEQVQAKDTPIGSLIINTSDLPSQYNDFFDAWELVDGKVKVNMGKAIEITKKRLRAEREPLLQAQDVAFQRALETGGNTSAIVDEKNRLRDITKLANNATTLEGLRTIKAEL
jgi:hypothetical protein